MREPLQSVFNFDELPDEIDLDQWVDETAGIIYLGAARRQPDNKYRVLANVGGALCMVEVTVTRNAS